MRIVLFLVGFVGALLCNAAMAEVVGYVEAASGDRIDLYREQGQCVGEARRASYVPANQLAPIAGCWVANGGGLMIVFMDGEIAAVPVAAVKRGAKA